MSYHRRTLAQVKRRKEAGMRIGMSTLILMIAATALVPRTQAVTTPEVDAGGPLAAGFCGVEEVSLDEQLLLRDEVSDWLALQGGARALGGNIRIAWHVIYSGSTGNIPQSQIDSTVAVLNRAFAGVPGGVDTGYTFSLASVDRTNKAAWFSMEAGTKAETQAKKALARDVPHRLNIYSCRPPSGANWGRFPWAYPENNKMHGVVLNINNLPGGSHPMNTGDIAVHEVGHYLGLYHTFQNGCSAPGDEVEDTPYEAVPPGCCPCNEGQDTCPSEGLDPIHNYMDYTSDLCKTEYTMGQDARIDAILPIYRPSLLNAPLPGDPAGSQPIALSDDPGSGIGVSPARISRSHLLGGSPNPFRTATTISYNLAAETEVKLRVFDGHGRMVRMLENSLRHAGSHEAIWDGRDGHGRTVPAGVYHLSLEAGKDSDSQRLVILP